jgi:hypothetical protein
VVQALTPLANIQVQMKQQSHLDCVFNSDILFESMFCSFQKIIQL